ncbi:histidine phosphatase family protein [Lonepinella sp. BR2919]|uniref:histidine phosphatase family protein n=1 Tax=unclassified Lonepinella TaxID=2642006 RepID=UPI003F6E0A8E
MRLILLRHGETEWNKSFRLQGHANSSLSERGIAQAKAIKPILAQFKPQIVVASDLGRVQQTAEIVGYKNVHFDAHLRELNMGDWTGKSKVDLLKEQPECYKAWRAGEFTPDNGESWQDFCFRIKTTLLSYIKKYPNQDILAIVHSGVIRVACHVFLGIATDKLLPVTPATLAVFDVDENHNLKLEAYNLGAFSPDIDVAD